MATFKRSVGSRYIEDIWDIADFRNVAENLELDLTDEELCEAMEYVADYFDANVGINWSTLEHAIEYVWNIERGKGGSMMQRYLAQFAQIKNGEHFAKNGYKWLKRSTRTAEIVNPDEYVGTWFYFAKREPVEITNLGALKDDN